MASLLGMCIDNTEEISNTIQITLRVHDAMNKIRGTMAQEEEN